MGKRIRIAFASLLVLAMCALAYAVLWPREPVYQGKTLRIWLEQAYELAFLIGPSSDERKAAIRQFGTNAIPALLVMAQAKDSPFRQRWVGFTREHPWLRLHPYTAEEYHNIAAVGFNALAEDGKAAVPALIELLQSDDPDLRDSAGESLTYIGPAAGAAIPLLLPGLNNTSRMVRMNTLFALRRIHMHPELVVPLLMQSLTPTNDLPGATIDALGAFSEQAKSAVPVIFPYMNDTDFEVRGAATNALQQIDPGAAAKVGIPMR